MSTYRTKETDYGYKKKIAVYDNPIKYGNKNPAPVNGRQKYAEMSKVKQMLSDDRRINYYKRKVHELIEIAMMNPDLCTVITLTFRTPVTSYNLAVAEWQSFLKRLRHLYPDTPLKYVCVWEYQKKRGDVFHFHALMNIGFIEHKKLEKIWGNGYVWIDQLGNDRKREKAVRYTMKYIVKQVVTRIENNEDVRGQRFVFTSNNLLKPEVTVLDEAVDIENLIFENMERMICDGSYDLKNQYDETINRVNYAVYEK